MGVEEHHGKLWPSTQAHAKLTYGANTQGAKSEYTTDSKSFPHNNLPWPVYLTIPKERWGEGLGGGINQNQSQTKNPKKYSAWRFHLENSHPGNRLL